MPSPTESPSQYIYIWEFLVAPEKVPEFEREYGVEGSWVRLFDGAKGYLGTELIRDRTRRGRYLTVDRWRSKDDYDRFMAENRDAFTRLDHACGELTLGERKIGEFSMADSPALGAGTDQ